MSKPRKVKVGYYDYKIKYIETNSADSHGQSSTDNKDIIVFNNGNAQVVRETLLHELLHVIMEDVTTIVFPDLKEEDADRAEEAIIRLISPRLMLFLKENKHFTRFIESNEG